MTLLEAADALRRARRAHSEAFLRYKALDDKRTDGMARAMADMDVDLVGAETDWVIAQQDLANKRLELIVELVLTAVGGTSDATEPAKRTN
jgi:hypothetical protein